ncbi:hypothetical protein UT300002_32210 [Clostridium perfringens]
MKLYKKYLRFKKVKKHTLKAEISLKDATNKCYLDNKEHPCVVVDEKGNI